MQLAFYLESTCHMRSIGGSTRAHAHLQELEGACVPERSNANDAAAGRRDEFPLVAQRCQVRLQRLLEVLRLDILRGRTHNSAVSSNPSVT